MNDNESIAGEFDLRPDPRILPMLGEINLAQWRCIAELIDNAIDAFIADKQAGNAVQFVPEVTVVLPKYSAPGAKITVIDNGPGMDPDQLERAMRAGWSGNNPIDALGLFGMGFNIATARLGVSTSVWTTRVGEDNWHGVRIDFEELQRKRHFITPHLVKSKEDIKDHGTKVMIDVLKPEQLDWFAKRGNRSKIIEELSVAYAAMLRPMGVPIHFKLQVNGEDVLPRNHCVWSEERVVETQRYGSVSPVQTFTTNLGERLYCTSCWQWLAPNSDNCVACGRNDDVVTRKRMVHGWLGIQRYLDENKFGIDFIRNGRKIEMENKELFNWVTDSRRELEYPIDDPRGRGRIVGEVHLDHCRVTYMKDRFDRNDPAWEEMLTIVRGSSPLRPDKARQLGMEQNNTRLGLLFNTFRRSNPKTKKGGGWAKLLVVKNNDTAKQYAQRYYQGDPYYQTDEKWWELVEEEDRISLLKGDDDVPPIEGFSGKPTEDEPDDVDDGGEETEGPARKRVDELSLTYNVGSTRPQKWKVEALSTTSDDPVLKDNDIAWYFGARRAGEYEFIFNPSHELFRSTLYTPQDALLADLAWRYQDAMPPEDRCHLSELTEQLRHAYADEYNVDPKQLNNDAADLLSDIFERLRVSTTEDERNVVYQELRQSEREVVVSRVAAMTGEANADLVTSGRFLRYLPKHAILRLHSQLPELFFDSRCFSPTYKALIESESTSATDAIHFLMNSYQSMLADTVWLAEEDLDELAKSSRAKRLRAALAVELLRVALVDD